MKKTFATLLSFLLVFSLFLPAMAENTSSIITLGTPANEEILPSYTPIVNTGNTYPLFAFTDAAGNTAFRVFATKGDEKGFYAATLTKLDANTQGAIQLKDLEGTEVYFAITVDSSAFITDAPEAFGKATPATPQKGLIDSGYKKVKGKENLYTYTDVFGQSQFRAWAAIDGESFYLYPANAGEAIEDGTLPIVQTNDLQAKLQKATYQLTEEFLKGWQQEVILTINGEEIIGLIDRPALSSAKKVAAPSTPAPQKTSPSEDKDTSGNNNNNGNDNGNNNGTGDLQLGSNGDRVYALTDALTQLGYLSAPTKDFDSNVKAAVVQFQKDNELKTDGIAGKNTIDLINHLLNTAPPAKTYPFVIRNNTSLQGSIASQFIGSSEVFGAGDQAKRNAEKGSAAHGSFTKGKEAVGIFNASDSAASIASALKASTAGLENCAYIEVGAYDFYMSAADEEQALVSCSVVIRGRDSNYD